MFPLFLTLLSLSFASLHYISNGYLKEVYLSASGDDKKNCETNNTACKTFTRLEEVWISPSTETISSPSRKLHFCLSSNKLIINSTLDISDAIVEGEKPVNDSMNKYPTIKLQTNAPFSNSIFVINNLCEVRYVAISRDSPATTTNTFIFNVARTNLTLDHVYVNSITFSKTITLGILKSSSAAVTIDSSLFKKFRSGQEPFSFINSIVTISSTNFTDLLFDSSSLYEKVMEVQSSFLNMTNSNIIIEDKNIRNIKKGSPCEWDVASILLDDSESYISSSIITNQSNGAIKVINGNLTISKVKFSNPILTKPFSTFEKNIRLENDASLIVKDLYEENCETTNSSLFFDVREGKVVNSCFREYFSPFFMPKIDQIISTCYSTSYEINIKGNDFFPCDCGIIFNYTNSYENEKSMNRRNNRLVKKLEKKIKNGLDHRVRRERSIVEEKNQNKQLRTNSYHKEPLYGTVYRTNLDSLKSFNSNSINYSIDSIIWDNYNDYNTIQLYSIITKNKQVFKRNNTSLSYFEPSFYYTPIKTISQQCSNNPHGPPQDSSSIKKEPHPLNYIIWIIFSIILIIAVIYFICLVTNKCIGCGSCYVWNRGLYGNYYYSNSYSHRPYFHHSPPPPPRHHFGGGFRSSHSSSSSSRSFSSRSSGGGTRIRSRR